MREEVAKNEADIEVIKAWLKSSSVFENTRTKEPYDMAAALVPLAYAVFEVIVEGATGSTLEVDWHDFLRDALEECISKDEAEYLDQSNSEG